MNSIIIKTGSLLLASTLLIPFTHKVDAAANQYEVKVYVDSEKVIKDNRHIDHSILESLGSEDKDKDFNVQYIDDSKRSNFSNQVTYRIRKSEENKKHELQYKKRYPIDSGNVDSAIEKAKKDGFTGDTYEVEYGENKQTLSVTKEADKNLGINKLALPNAKESLDLLKDQASTPFDRLLKPIDKATIIGPVHFERHKGNIDGHKIKIENWDIGEQNVVEVSAKVNTEADAKTVQQAVVNKLDELGIHEKEDKLKTNMIFDKY